MSDGGSLPPHRRSRDGVATPALAISALLLALVAMAPIIALVASLWLHSVAAADDDKVVICHNTGNGHKTIEVAPSAVDSHLSHGDTLGPCDDSTPTPSPTVSPTASPTATPTVPPTETPTPSPTTTPEPTATPTPTSTASPSPTATPSPTPSATATPTLTATATPTSTPDPTPSSTATPAPTPGPTQTPASTPSPAATPGPTGTPGSTAAPSPAAPATATAPVASTTPEALPPPAPAATPTAVSVALPATPVFIAGPEGLPVALNLPPAAVVSAPPTFATAPLAPAPSPTAPTATTPVATRTPTPGPTPTPSATPTHTPAPALSSAPPTPQADNAARSVFVRDFPAFNQLSTSPAVLLTNAALSLLALMLILLACSVFNATLEENGSELASVITRLVAPFGLSLAWLRGPDDDADGQRPISFWRLALILLAVAAIYAGLDPDFGWNASTAALVISLTVGVGLLTVVYEGAQVVLGSRAGGVHSSLQLQPLGIVIAALSVILTRVTNIHPGIVLGVIAGAAVGSHDAKLQGRIVTAAMLGILGLSLGALLLVDPFQTLSSTHASAWWAVIPETVVVTLFVGGIEGLLFSLLPLKFMEGRRVWDWSRPVWFILALAASFLFFHVVLNRTDAYTSVVEETGVQALLVICVLSIAVASVFWLACRLWLPGEAQPEVA